MTKLTLFHTADVHRATFDTLARRIAPDAQLSHVVRPDWLARAQDGIDVALSDEIQAEISRAPKALCTCTSIAEVATQVGALRIDRPMMDAAAATGGPVLIAYCLDSTAGPSRDLLCQAFADIGQTPNIRMLPMTDLWILFQTGETEEFVRQIAKRIDDTLNDQSDATCVVLAQASMAEAAQHVTTSAPVLSSPELALRYALGLEPY